MMYSEEFQSVEIKYKEVPDGTKFYFIEVGRKQYRKPDLLVWISSKFLSQAIESENRFGRKMILLQFPVNNAKITKTERGSIVLKYEPGWKTFNVEIQPGFRGRGELEILEPQDDSRIARYVIYKSEIGSKGVGQGALISIQPSERIRYRWLKSGRLYGNPPTGVVEIDYNGKRRSLEGAESFEDVEVLKRELGEGDDNE